MKRLTLLLMLFLIPQIHYSQTIEFVEAPSSVSGWDVKDQYYEGRGLDVKIAYDIPENVEIGYAFLYYAVFRKLNAEESIENNGDIHIIEGEKFKSIKKYKLQDLDLSIFHGNGVISFSDNNSPPNGYVFYYYEGVFYVDRDEYETYFSPNSFLRSTCALPCNLEYFMVVYICDNEDCYFDYSPINIEAYVHDCQYGGGYDRGCSLSSDEFKKQKLTISPNPVTETLYVSEELTIAKYKIVDSKGMILKQAEFENSIDVSNLSSGLYFLVTDVGTIRFIKE